ncbi:MAG: c-type cytochrome, partial [Stellaceae bacterium]
RGGEAIYVDNCSACHGPAGKGVANLFPALDDNPIVQSKDATSLIRVTLEGTQNVATSAAPTGSAMPAFYWKLSDAQIADALTYIRNSWGNRASIVSSGQVGDVRSEPTQQ